MEFSGVLLALCMAFVCFSNTSAQNGASIDVTSFGAKGDGQSDDTQAFLKAWAAACQGTSGNPVISIPGGKSFLVTPMSFTGPCISSQITVQVGGTVIASGKGSGWNGENEWLSFNLVQNLVIEGDGTFDGQGSGWWQSCSGNGDCTTNPFALAFHACQNLRLSGVHVQNSPGKHIALLSNGAVLTGLTIVAPETSPNTDGISISQCSNVQINNCEIATGDDCISIFEGSSNINITSVTCGPGHGISIGSLGAKGVTTLVEEVLVQNCTMKGTQNGARIKTRRGGYGFARQITFNEIFLFDVMNPIIVDQFYDINNPTDKVEAAMTDSSSAVRISDVSFTSFNGTTTSEDAITMICSKSTGCTNMVLSNIFLQPAASQALNLNTSCVNAQGTSSNVNPNANCLM